MKTLMLRHGDLVPGSRGAETVSGVSRLVQDLRAALGEPYGVDRFHPGWGSVVDEFVGAPLDESTAFDVEQEVNRVIGNYMAVQGEKIQRDSINGDARRFRQDDVIARVQSVEVTTRNDQATISITVETMSREVATMSVDVGGIGG